MSLLRGTIIDDIAGKMKKPWKIPKMEERTKKVPKGGKIMIFDGNKKIADPTVVKNANETGVQ